MYKLTVEDTFSSAHQLRGYKGKCENLHGHNWKTVLSIQGEELDETGLLIDFHILKKILKEILSQLDHKNVNDVYPFTEINPSSENISKFIAKAVSIKLEEINKDILVESVTVWESESSRCTFIPEK